MQRTQIRIFLLTMVIAGLAAVASYGQSTQYRGKIPFDFTARGKKMKTGDYRLKEMGGGLVISQVNGKGIAILGPATNQGFGSGKAGKLVFVRDGASYALTEVDTPAFKVKLKHTATSVNVAMSKPEIVEIKFVE